MGWAEEEEEEEAHSDCRSCKGREKSVAAETTVKGLHYCLNQGKCLKLSQMC